MCLNYNFAIFPLNDVNRCSKNLIKYLYVLIKIIGNLKKGLLSHEKIICK